MERIERETSYNKCRERKEIISDVSCDYTLPDYLGDIKRIVMIRECVSVGGAYYEAGQLFGGGIVTYNVIYVDAEGKLASVEFSSDYECSSKCDTDNPIDVCITSRLLNVNLRATTPRKLVAKATLSSNLRAHSEESILLPEEFNSDILEYRTEICDVRSSYITRLPEREYAEKICFLDGVMLDDVSIIAKSANPYIRLVESEDGAIIIKGEVKIECAVMCAPLAPIKETVTVQINEECQAKAKHPIHLQALTNVSSLVISVNATESGCEIMCDMILDISVIEEENKTVCMPTDAYAPGSITECGYDTVTLDSIVGVIDESFKNEARFDRSDLGMKDIRDIIVTDATLKSDPLKREGDTILLTGEIKYSGMATEITEDGAISYVSFKNTAPFSYNVNNYLQNIDNLTFDITASVHDIECTIDKGDVVCGCSLKFTGIIGAKKSLSYISSVSLTDKATAAQVRKVSVYYPDKDESLYDVAKRFDTTCRAVANINSLGIDVASTPTAKGGLKDVRRLIIY